MRSFGVVSSCLLLGLAACGDDAKSSSAADAASQWQHTSAQDATSSAGGSDAWGGNTSSTQSADTASSPTSSSDASPSGDTAPTGNTHIAFGGAQDFGYPRALIAAGQVPKPSDLDPAGFFAEHSTPLPPPSCGERMCVQAMLGVMGNLLTGQACTMLQLGLNSPIEVDATQRPPLTLAVVVDTSGSMQQDNKIGFVRDGLAKLVNQLHDEDRIAIIQFATTVEVVAPMTDVRDHRNQLLGVVAGLEATGGTNIHDGLREGFQAVQQAWNSGRQNRVILLSDGQATAGITADSEILAMSLGFNSDGIGLTTVGLGTDFNFPLMQGLAEQADGNFYFLENATAVDEVFTEELAYFTLPVAFDVSLVVETGSDYDLVRASGSDRFELDATGGHMQMPSVFFAHRLAHDDVHEGEDGVGRRGGGSALVLELMPKHFEPGFVPMTGDVAEVTLSFREPGSNEVKTDTVYVDYPHAPDQILETGFFENLIVTKTFVMLNIYVAIETACELFHGGQPAAGMNVLLRVIAGAEDYEDSANDGQGDVDIAYDVQLMKDLVQVIETQAHLNDPPPPAIPENPWPAD